MADVLPWRKVDAEYMHRALVLAERARGRTSPNPLVGAVIVQKDEIVGEGYHRLAGEAHAEVHALNQVRNSAHGGTMYVTLEPCCHWGKTPPCTEAIIEAGITEVFVAHADTNPQVSGKGIRRLRAAGIRVSVGLREADARRLNENFIKYIQTKRPFVILKAGMSLDGKIATASGESQWITSAPSRLRGHEIRNEVDAILVGMGTVSRDNPSLTTRLPDRLGKNPIRIVVDSFGRTSPQAKIFDTDAEPRAIVAVTQLASDERIASLESVGAEVLVSQNDGNRVCLFSLMKTLGEREITSLLIEGGAEISASALESRIVDKIVIFFAPKLIGGKEAPGMIGGGGVQHLAEAYALHDLTVRLIGKDIFVEGYLGMEY